MRHFLLTVLVLLFLLSFSGSRAQPVTGLGKAITLESTRSEGMDMVNKPSLQWGQSSFTVEAWIKRPAGAGFFTIAGKQNPGAGTGWFFRLNGNRLSFATLGGVTNFVDGTTDITDNNWHHVAAVMNAAAKTLTIYIDGEVEKSTGFTTASNISNTQKLGVGYKPNYGEYFNGSMDEVRIWKVARTQSEIKGWRNTPLTGTETGLEACWGFEEGTGTAVADLSASDNDGTLLGTDGDEWITGNIPYVRTLAEDNLFSLRLGGSEPGNTSGVTALVTQLPGHGKLYQTSDGITKGTEITATGTLLNDAGGYPRRLIYEPILNYNGSDLFTYQVNNGTVNAANTETVSLTITAVNDEPVITSHSGVVSPATVSLPFAENGSSVTTVTATDAENDVLTFTISGGSDAARFSINGTTGILSFTTAPDFENPQDSDGNNEYGVVVRVSDGSGYREQILIVSVTNVNDNTPVITSDGGGANASVSIAENNTAVTTVTATDADAGTTLTYSLNGGADAALFTINSTTGALVFSSAPDYESPTDADGNNTYVVVVRAGDGTNTVDQAITVTITNVNDNTPVITSGASVSIAENTTAVTTVVATDADAGTTITYSLNGGADAAKFSISSSTGALVFSSAPDYENPTDADANNTYVVVVRAGDGTNTADQAITVTVTNTNDNTPVITSGSSVSIAENNTAVTTVTATDADAGTTITYSLNGGADAAKFSINSTTGALVFSSAPDYENPTDADANNTYVVVVRASDGTNTADQAITVTVTNTNDNTPVITSGASVSIAENNTAVTTVTATDADAGTTITYSLNGGADAAKFSINGSTGALVFSSAPDYENPTDADANNTYVVVVRAGDGTNTADQAITVTVTNVNDNTPVITSGASVSIAENNTAVTTVTATDADAGTTITYSLNGGADAALFTINGTTGALVFSSAPDYENPTDADGNNTYVVVVRAEDGSNTSDQAITVTVTNTNDNTPVITSGSSVNIAENTTAVTTVVATDADAGTTLNYSLNGGADAALFTINSTTGALVFSAAPDYESPTDADANNSYVVVVRASDGTNTIDQTITITITNTNDNIPVITSGSSVSIAENNTAVTTVTATDADAGTTITYSLNGGADAAKFSISSSTGALVFSSAPDYENPTDADANNTYVVVVRAGDGTNTVDQAITVTVTNVNDNTPVITSNGGGATASVSIVNPQQLVTTVTATDADGILDPLSYSIGGGADALQFGINTNSGELSFLQPTNYLVPTDANQDNIYIVIVSVSDGIFTSQQTISVTVTGIMPVVLLNFNGFSSGAVNRLEWSTASEVNMLGYEVERSEDGLLFNSIGFVASKPGHYNVYSFVDTSPLTTGFYRLKMVNADASYRHSSIIKISHKALVTGVRIYPNPVSGRTFQLQMMQMGKGIYEMTWHNTTGQLVHRQKLEYTGAIASLSCTLPSAITPGLYLVRLKGEQQAAMMVIVR